MICQLAHCWARTALGPDRADRGWGLQLDFQRLDRTAKDPMSGWEMERKAKIPRSDRAPGWEPEPQGQESPGSVNWAELPRKGQCPWLARRWNR